MMERLEESRDNHEGDVMETIQQMEHACKYRVFYDKLDGNTDDSCGGSYGKIIFH